MSFIRVIKTKSGRYEAEVESYRKDGKVKQRVINWLGKVEKPLSRASRLANAMGLMEQAQSGIETLAEELESWHDNMSGTNLESTGKYQRLEEAADNLRRGIDHILDATSELENVEIPTMFG